MKQLVSQIPRGHNIPLSQLLQNIEQRLWYANKTLEHGWIRNVLWHWIDSVYGRGGGVLTNSKSKPPTTRPLQDQIEGYLSYRDSEKLTTLSSEISWSYNAAILSGREDLLKLI